MRKLIYIKSRLIKHLLKHRRETDNASTYSLTSSLSDGPHIRLLECHYDPVVPHWIF